jgi:hypothetical protein
MICKTVFQTLSIPRESFSTATGQWRELQGLARHGPSARRHFRRILKKLLGKSKKHAY